MARGYHTCPDCGGSHLNIHNHEQAMAHEKRTRTTPMLRGVPVYRIGEEYAPVGFKAWGDRLNTVTAMGNNTFMRKREQ